jgi:hypothetical protein
LFISVFSKVHGFFGTVGLTAARNRLRNKVLKIVPVLHDQPVLKAENVEPDFGTEKIVLRMGEDKITVLIGPDHPDLAGAVQLF